MSLLTFNLGTTDGELKYNRPINTHIILDLVFEGDTEVQRESFLGELSPLS